MEKKKGSLYEWLPTSWVSHLPCLLLLSHWAGFVCPHVNCGTFDFCLLPSSSLFLSWSPELVVMLFLESYFPATRKMGEERKGKMVTWLCSLSQSNFPSSLQFKWEGFSKFSVRDREEILAHQLTALARGIWHHDLHLHYACYLICISSINLQKHDSESKVLTQFDSISEFKK